MEHVSAFPQRYSYGSLALQGLEITVKKSEVLKRNLCDGTISQVSGPAMNLSNRSLEKKTKDVSVLQHNWSDAFMNHFNGLSFQAGLI